jgi:hypothetical protein
MCLCPHHWGETTDMLVGERFTESVKWTSAPIIGGKIADMVVRKTF